MTFALQILAALRQQYRLMARSDQGVRALSCTASGSRRAEPTVGTELDLPRSFGI
jgi:hypothetical protein